MSGIIDDIKDFFFGKTQLNFLQSIGGQGVYSIDTIDLSVAHTDHEVLFDGESIIVIQCDSSAYMKLHTKKNDLIPLDKVAFTKARFEKFYITNDAGSGSLILLLGKSGMFTGLTKAIVTIDDISDLITGLDLDRVANGNPQNLYAYNQDWYDGTQVYKPTGAGHSWQTFISQVIDVTDMSFILGRESFKYDYVGGGSPSGSQNGRIIVAGDSSRSMILKDIDKSIFGVGGVSDEPAENVWEEFYVYMDVRDLTGNQTVSFQGRSGGINIDIYGDEFYLYDQIVGI